MTQEITDIIERNLDNLYHELDELAWDGQDYNPYIEEEALHELGRLGDGYAEHIEAGTPYTLEDFLRGLLLAWIADE